ncbi:hypothetical protein CPB86DRAFT_828299 [Serendipita vermifera]|nr:hypothetical protein CPB86DRAFT_828299 [Serendipita vermifera]
MVVVTESLTIGQLAFILRVVIQAFSMVGPFLVGLLILSNAPKIASFRTHGVINRITGRFTATNFSLTWIWHYSRQPDQNPIRSLSFPLSIAFLCLYGLVAKLSDVGFLGFHTCSIPSTQSKYAHPDSITDDVFSQSIILDNMANGTNPNTLKVHRCDTSALTPIGLNTTVWNCTTWHNSTWIDRNFFSNINNTDTDMLMPRNLAASEKGTSFFADTGSQRIENTTISGGILVSPSDIGFQAIFGVPSLGPEQSFTLDQAMALEVETGCMSLGISSMKAATSNGSGVELFSTNGTWRRYIGPDVLYEPLLSTTDAIRDYWRPLFDESSINSEGNIFGTSISVNFTDSLTVQGLDLPAIGDNYDPKSRFYETCTNKVREKIGLSPRNSDRNEEYSCSLLGIGGEVELEGSIFGTQNHMLCASTVQINMVSARIHSDTQGNLSFNLTRLPSDLNLLIADNWEIEQGIEGEIVSKSAPIRRFTLSENGRGSTSHYVAQYPDLMSTQRTQGLASGGYALARVGSRVLHTDSAQQADHGALEELGGNAFETTLDPTTLTRWSGQIGASYILASLRYNPWSALDQSPILVTSEGTQLAICYHSAYIVAFLPLLASFLLAAVWGIITLTRISYGQLRSLGRLYGGLYPYWSSVCPNIGVKDVFLIWRNDPYIRLDVVAPQKDTRIRRRRVTRVNGYLPLGSEHELDAILDI